MANKFWHTFYIHVTMLTRMDQGWTTGAGGGGGGLVCHLPVEVLTSLSPRVQPSTTGITNLRVLLTAPNYTAGNPIRGASCFSGKAS